jgi:hypothetical protein
LKKHGIRIDASKDFHTKGFADELYGEFNDGVETYILKFDINDAPNPQALVKDIYAFEKKNPEVAIQFGKYYAKGGKFNDNLYVDQLASMSGARAVAVKEFASANNLSKDDLLNIIQGLGRKQITASQFVNAVLGNKTATSEVVSYAKEGKGFKMAKGGKTKKFGYSIELVVKKDYGNEGGIVANFVGKGDAMISARALNENSPENYEYSVKESSKMAKGGLTEHGLEVGDEIVMDVKKTTMGKMPTTIGVKDYDKEFHLVDLDKGERYAKGGEVEEMALSKSRLEFAEYNLSELEKEGKTSSNSSQYREWERFKKQYENKIKRLEQTLNPTFPKIKMENISDEDLKKKHTRALWNVNELRLGNLKPSKVIKTGRVTKEKADQFLMDIAKQYEIEMKKRGMPVYAQGGTAKRIKRMGC